MPRIGFSTAEQTTDPTDPPDTTPAKPAHVLSPQQQAVLDWARDSTGSLILTARAGCGKTSTLLALCSDLVRRLPTVSIYIGAFNRSIANEIAGKLSLSGIGQHNAQAGTLHSAGLAAWRKLTGWSATDASKRIDSNKLCKLWDAAHPHPKPADRAQCSVCAEAAPYRDFCLKAVSFAKQRGFGALCSADDISLWRDLVEHFGLEDSLRAAAADSDSAPPDLDAAISRAAALYSASLAACRESIDFDDMLLAPLYFSAPIRQYDWVMVDELQDTSPVRRELAMRMLKPGGRFCGVGDPAQNIYAFSGSDSDAMEQCRIATNAIVLPLNTTYRCPKAVVRRAHAWVSDITAHPSAPEGVERRIWLTKGADRVARPCLADESLTPADVVLCRNVKPLVELAYTLLRRGVACQVEGRDIAHNLFELCGRWQTDRASLLAARLTAWRDREVTRWTAADNERRAEECADRADTLLALISQLAVDGKHTVSDLTAFIRSMFGDTPDGQRAHVLTLSTIHKSKGREWPRVYILGQAKYQPSPYAKKGWQIEGEYNLLYVAATRAQAEVVDVVVD